jgi:alpha-beta hydrolase superfamily lysophospholipase
MQRRIGNLAAWVHPAEDGEALARVLFLHGLGEHSGRHRRTIASLNRHGFEAVRFDFRGCGESGGEKQWIDGFRDYVDDVLSVHRWILSELPSRPLYFLGHSLGGGIALHAAPELGRALAGLVLSAPAFEVGDGVSKFKIAAGRVIDRFRPHTRIGAALDLSALSRDPHAAKEYAADPLCCRFNTVRQGASILKALGEIPAKARDIDTPTLIIHGERDRIIPPSGSRRIFDLLPATDKKLVLFPGAFHELHNDLCRDEYFRVLGEWLETHARAT